MHPTHLAQLSADHRTNLRTQAASLRLLAPTRQGGRRRVRRYQWQLRSPIVRRPAPFQTTLCR